MGAPEKELFRLDEIRAVKGVYGVLGGKGIVEEDVASNAANGV